METSRGHVISVYLLSSPNHFFSKMTSATYKHVHQAVSCYEMHKCQIMLAATSITEAKDRF